MAVNTPGLFGRRLAELGVYLRQAPYHDRSAGLPLWVVSLEGAPWGFTAREREGESNGPSAPVAPRLELSCRMYGREQLVHTVSVRLGVDPEAGSSGKRHPGDLHNDDLVRPLDLRYARHLGHLSLRRRIGLSPSSLALRRTGGPGLRRACKP